MRKNIAVDLPVLFITFHFLLKYLVEKNLIDLPKLFVLLQEIPILKNEMSLAFEIEITVLFTLPFSLLNMITKGFNDAPMITAIQTLVVILISNFLVDRQILLANKTIILLCSLFYFMIVLPSINEATNFVFSHNFSSPVSEHQSPRASPRTRRAHSANPLEQEPYTQSTPETPITSKTKKSSPPSELKPKMKTRAEILLQRMKEEDET